MPKTPKPDFATMTETDLLRQHNAMVREIRSRGCKDYRETTIFEDRKTGMAFCEDRWSTLKALRSWQ